MLHTVYSEGKPNTDVPRESKSAITWPRKQNKSINQKHEMCNVQFSLSTSLTFTDTDNLIVPD